MKEPVVDLRDYVKARDLQFQPQIGERYFELLIRYALRIGDVERSTLMSILHRLGWSAKTLEYHARLIRDCDAGLRGRMQQSFDRLAVLAAAFGLQHWFDRKFPVKRPKGGGVAKVIRTRISARPRQL